jgi:peptidyl-prolyl cis-trans isomerase SurA
MFRHLILISAVTALFFSCKPSEPTVINVGEESIKTKEFKYIYEKNHAKDHDRYSKNSLDNYLDLFVNYRLKVLEAENLKLDSAPAFQVELNGYKKQLAKPYFADDLMTETLAKQAYDRSKIAIKARHILIKVDETASPQDTLYAYNRMVVIKDTIAKGADFGTMAYEFSQDPSAKSTPGRPGYKGALGYFSSLRMVYAFENVAFNTPKGKTSDIIRTKFGYHILQVQDIYKMQYRAKVAHIMIKAASGLPKNDSIDRATKANNIYKEILKREDWNTLCAKYSDHTKTAAAGGVLPDFTLGGSLGLPNFEMAAYEIDSVGHISKPVKTPYGWHIIKLIEKVPFQPYEEVKKEYVSKVKRDSRSQQNKTALSSKLKKENGFKESKDKATLVQHLADDQLMEQQWNVEDHAENLQENLFTIGKKKYKIYDFAQYIESNQKKTKKGSKEYMIETLYSNFVSESLISYEEEQLPNKHFEYKMLIQEFHDGILIYDLMKAQVWDKANKDTVGLNAFYKTNQSNYKAPDEIRGTIFTVIDMQHMPSIKIDLERGVSTDSILKKYNTDTTTVVTVNNGAFEKGKNHVFDAAQWTMETPVEMYQVAGKNYIIKKEAVRVNKNYSLDEVRGRVVADYQKELEANFITELKGKYPVEVIEKEYNSLIKY